MEILDIGTGELLFIAALLLIFIGPKRMAESWSSMGKWLNEFIRSDTWKALRSVSREISNAPNRMMRDANMEELEGLGRELDLSVDSLPYQKKVSASKSASVHRAPVADESLENSILPANPKRSVSISSAPPPTHPDANQTTTKTVAKKKTAAKSKVLKSSASKTKPAKKKRADA